MKYRDLEGNVLEAENTQDKLLRFLYTRTWGRLLLKPLISPGISRAVGCFLDSRISRCLIAPFIRANHLDMRPYVERAYVSFNDFFTREMKQTERMVDADPSYLVSPSDGKVSAYHLSEEGRFEIKQRAYSLEAILKSRKLAGKYKGGYAIVIRLSVEDYHRYCYPVSGRKTRNYRIPGKLHTVNPIACETVPVYHENAREFTLIRTERFGDVLQMEVGALLVGRICNYQDKALVRKGQEKGKFEFGGSTILLLLEAERVQVREELLTNTREGCETLVQMGQYLARAR